MSFKNRLTNQTTRHHECECECGKAFPHTLRADVFACGPHMASVAFVSHGRGFALLSSRLRRWCPSCCWASASTTCSSSCAHWSACPPSGTPSAASASPTSAAAAPSPSRAPLGCGNLQHADPPIAISHPTLWSTPRDRTASCMIYGGAGLGSSNSGHADCFPALKKKLELMFPPLEWVYTDAVFFAIRIAHPSALTW